MKNKQFSGIERNKLDYLLTDSLPVEISELFSFRYFYDYLLEHKTKELDSIFAALQTQKSKINGNETLFKSSWATMPLKTQITKQKNSLREINIMQPISALNIYFFIQLYQKDILNFLSKNSHFSLRYHGKRTAMFYKQRQRSLTQYFIKTSKNLDRSALEQTGAYYNIGKYNSVSGFTSSRDWQRLCSRYKYFAKIDYKSCFDSVYTHAYKWLVSRDVVDSKDFENNNLFTVIDRVLQNINARSSNGLIVGPEFSRMMAEILLQAIDNEVHEKLLLKGVAASVDYNIYRYVDDVFIFSDKEDLIDLIITEYTTVANTFLMKINEQKEMRHKLPFSLNDWIRVTNNFSNELGKLFYTQNEVSDLAINYLLKEG